MRYNFFSKNSDLHFSVFGNEVFNDVWDYVNKGIVDEEVKEKLSTLNITNGVHVDKYTTKIMSENLEKYQNNLDTFEYMNHLTNERWFNDDDKDIPDLLVKMMSFLLFIKFIKRSRGGFVICMTYQNPYSSDEYESPVYNY